MPAAVAIVVAQPQLRAAAQTLAGDLAALNITVGSAAPLVLRLGLASGAATVGAFVECV